MWLSFSLVFSLLFPNCELLERRYLLGLADSWPTPSAAVQGGEGGSKCEHSKWRSKETCGTTMEPYFSIWVKIELFTTKIMYWTASQHWQRCYPFGSPFALKSGRVTCVWSQICRLDPKRFVNELQRSQMNVASHKIHSDGYSWGPKLQYTSKLLVCTQVQVLCMICRERIESRVHAEVS